MRPSCLVLLTCLLAVALAASLIPGRTAALGGEAPLILAGSGLNLPLTRILVQAFQAGEPQARLEVPPSLGSLGGIRAAADGAVALGLISRPLSGEERSLGLVVRPYARTANVLAAHPGVPDDGLSFEELVGIYRGRKRMWRNGQPIVVLARDPRETVNELFQREIPGFGEALAESFRAGRWMVLFSDQEMNEALQRLENSFGPSDLGAIQSQGLAVKTLRLNGLSADPASIAAGRYPFLRTLSFIHRAGAPPPVIQAFLDFVESPEAHRIIQANGYLPRP